jgi:sugar porter (SP) family MFS transporter
LPSFKNEFGFTGQSTATINFYSANVVSCFQGGCFFGAFMIFPLTEKIGRRFALMVCAAVFEVGSLIQLLSFGSLPAIYVGRFVGGWAVGAACLIVPVYISEVSPPAIRGRMVGFFEIMFQIGAVFGFWIPYGVNRNLPSNNQQWMIPFALQLIPGGILFFGMFFAKETPRWLAKKGAWEKCIDNLCWIRKLPADHEYVAHEVHEMRAQLEHESKMIRGTSFFSQFKELGMKGVRNRLAIGMCMMMCQNLTGINGINYYSPTIFKSLGVSSTSTSLFATGIYGIVKMCTTIIALVFFLDRFGRRKLLLIGGTGAALAMFYIGAYVAIAKPSADNANPQAAGYVAIAMIYVFVVFYCASWNGIVWIYCSEIFPLRIRTLCCAFTSATQWLFQFVIARSTPYMISNIGYGTYLFFGSCTILMTIWAYFCVPETKGRTLESMDQLFGATTMSYDNEITEDEVQQEKASAVHEESQFSKVSSSV